MVNINTPQFTKANLEELEKKINENSATAEDYKQLENIIAPRGMKEYVLNKMKEYKLYSYQHFIDERKKSINDQTRNEFASGAMVGVFIGVISALKKAFLI